MQRTSIRKLTLGGILAAAIILLTTVVSIPIPGGLGYVNLGDAGVLSAALLLGSPWGVLCGGLASALSDLLLGYAVYAPATMLIKSGMAAVMLWLYRVLPKKLRTIAFFLASLCVPIGYLLYESCLYGVASAMPNLLFNCMQGWIGALAAWIVTHAIEQIDIKR